MHLAAILASQFLISASVSAFLPAMFSYLTAIKQQQAAAASSGLHSIMFIASGVLILVASSAASAIGTGPFFTILAGLNLVAAGAASVQILRRRQESKESIRAASQKQMMQQVADSTSDIEGGTDQA